MNKKFNLIFFFSVILLWAAFSVFNAVSPSREFSENENRELASFPEFSPDRVLSGTFMEEFNGYVNDQFVLRDDCVKAYYLMEYARNMREINGVYICKDSLISNIDEPKPECVDANINGVNLLTERFADKNVYVMIVPSSSEIQRDRLPLFASSWDQKSEIESIYSRINGAKCIDVTQTLTEHKDEYIFYRTDHHWTTFGASLACSEFRKAAGLPERDFEFTVVSDGFNGTVFSKTGAKIVEPDVIEAVKVEQNAKCTVYKGKNGTEYGSVYFDEYLSTKDKYCYFLGTNQAVVKIVSDCGTGKKLLMFKDSYSHCFAPMLLDEYSEILLVDARYLNLRLSEFADLSTYGDVLFLYSVDGFASQDSLRKMSAFLSPAAGAQGGENNE